MSRLTQEKREHERNIARHIGKALGIDPDGLPFMIALEELEEHEAKLAKIEAIARATLDGHVIGDERQTLREILEVVR